MAPIQEGPDEFNEKALRTEWPVVEGLIFGTTKQTNTKHLTPELESLVSSRDKCGFT